MRHLLIPLLAAGLLLASDEPELIRDGGFEAAAPGPWRENNWAGNLVEFARDGERPWQGRFSQRLSVRRLRGSTDLQLYQPLTGLGPGAALRVDLALRGLANLRPLAVEVRRIGAPYTAYAATEVPVTEDWRTASLLAVLPDDVASDLGLYLRFADEGTVWIDGVSTRRLPAIDPEPAAPGNLLANGSFEVGRDGWNAQLRGIGPVARATMAEGAIRPGDWQVVAAADAPAGRRVLAVRLGEDARAITTSAWFPYRHGQPMRVSLAVAGTPGMRAEVSLGHGEHPHLVRPLRQALPVAAAWTRHVFTAVPGASATGRLFLEVSADGPGELRLDDVRVEQAPGPDRLELGCAAVAPVPGLAYLPQEHPRLRVHAAGAGAGAVVDARVQVEDAWGAVQGAWSLPIPCDQTGAGAAEADLPAGRFGGFRATVTVDGRRLAEHLYAVIPDLPAPDGSGRSFFGGHFQLTPYTLDLAERGGFRWLRLHPPLITKWAAQEPEPGQITLLSAPVDLAVRRGFSVLGSLDAPPVWASVPGIPGPHSIWANRLPHDWAAWSAYVQRTLASFPAITAWEVWNEPDGAFLVVREGEDKVAAYAAVTARTRQAVETTGRNVRLIGPAVATIDRPFLATFLARGGAADLDVVSFHYYFEDVDPLQKRPSFIDQLAGMRARPGRGGQPPALWHSEGGMWLRQSPSWRELQGGIAGGSESALTAAHSLVRTAVALKALGVERHFQYAGFTSPSGSGGLAWRSECAGLIDVDGSARPSFAAHAAMVWLLDAAEPAGADSAAVGEATVCMARFRHPQHGEVVAAWSTASLPASAVPALARPWAAVRDLMGNPLVAAPVLGPAPLYFLGR